MKNTSLLILGIAYLLCTTLRAQNNALKFGNSSPQDYVQINYDTALNLGTGPFTFEAQVKIPSSVGSAQTIVSNRTVTFANTGYWIYINTSGSLAFTLGGFAITGIGNSLKDNTCHHIALSRNSSGILSVYIDGMLQSAYGVTNNLTNTFGHPTWLGKDDFDPSASHFEGTMDEVRIWKVSRTAAQVDSFKNTSVNSASVGLVTYYQFNQGIAAGNNSTIFSLTNASSLNYNGTLINFTLSGTTSNFVAGCGGGCSAFAGNDTFMCLGNTIVLHPSPAGGTFTDNGIAFSGLNYTPTSTGLHTLIYSSTPGCIDTMMVIVRAKPNLGPDRSICKNDSISFPPPNAANQVSYTDNGISFLSVFYGSTTGSHTIIANAAGCRDTVVITVKDTCNNISICNYFMIDAFDSNCCRAGIIRAFQGGPNVVSVRYQVTGGVVQGYTTNCSGSLPTSVNVSGTAGGLVTFSPSCGNMQLFSTALQSTTSTGAMVVTYTVRFATGDSCKYTSNVTGCARAPQTSCDKFKVIKCICSGSLFSYIKVNILNNAAPASPICNVIITKYTSANVIQSTYFTDGAIVSPFTYLANPNTNIAIFPAIVVNTGNTIDFQLNYPNSTPFNGYIKITVIHCNGDTCKYTWAPKIFLPSEATFVDYNLSKGVNPYSKLYAYTLKITGPTQTPATNNPYKIRYISLNLPDTGSAEIAACTGAQQFNEVDKVNKLKMSLSSHSRKNAFFQLMEPLSLQPKDSSGILQLIFANNLPASITFNFYDDEGNVMTGGNVTVDTSLSTGVYKLGKAAPQLNEPLLFNVFPNPASQRLDFKLNIPHSDNIVIQIVNAEGREVYRKELGTMNMGIADLFVDISQLDDGYYFINAKCKGSGDLSNAVKILVIK